MMLGVGTERHIPAQRLDVPVLKVEIVAGPTRGSSSDVSSIVKSDNAEMLVDGDRVMGDPGTVSVSEAVMNSSGGGCGTWGLRFSSWL